MFDVTCNSACVCCGSLRWQLSNQNQKQVTIPGLGPGNETEEHTIEMLYSVGGHTRKLVAFCNEK